MVVVRQKCSRMGVEWRSKSNRGCNHRFEAKLQDEPINVKQYWILLQREMMELAPSGGGDYWNYSQTQSSIL